MLKGHLNITDDYETCCYHNNHQENQVLDLYDNCLPKERKHRLETLYLTPLLLYQWPLQEYSTVTDLFKNTDLVKLILQCFQYGDIHNFCSAHHNFPFSSGKSLC